MRILKLHGDKLLIKEFTPELSIKALEYFYNQVPKLWGKYGFKDAYNLHFS